MTEFAEYADDRICIRIPKQLRKVGVGRYFRGNVVRGDPESCFHVLVDIDPHSLLVDVRRRQMLGPAVGVP